MIIKNTILLTYISLCLGGINAILYDTFSGKPVNKTQLKVYKAKNNIGKCTIDVKPCDPTEHRRVDGTCNSLEHPSQGTFTIRHPRILPPAYFNGSYPRKAVSGKDLPLPRNVRVKLLCEGTSVNHVLTQAVPGFGIFTFGDVGSTHDIKFLLLNKSDCCSTGRNDYMCAPNIIPEDDPVHRFSGIRCLNMSRPLDFQYLGCTNETTPSPINEATAVFDLSIVYNAGDKGDKVIRSYEGGQLLTEVEDGITWPPNGTAFCPANDPGDKCFKHYSNALLSTQLFSVWFMKLHNYIATQLAEINPCWDDHQLFFNAREINMAFYQQVDIYEWLALLVGKKNLIECGIASKSCGCRDIYDETTYPVTTLELIYVFRWFHIIQAGSAKMYDTDGTFLRDYPIVNNTFRTGHLAKDRNIYEFTQGHFRQPCAQANHGVANDMAQMGLPYIQQSVDVPTSDLHKNRMFGLRPYIDYVHLCYGYKIKCWNDLKRLIKHDKIKILQDVYEDVEDIDLMAGLWTENLLEGGHVPPTLACILKNGILRTIKGDRHWYERCNRPYAFNPAQLQEIRKASFALLLCTAGDGVTEVQRHAFMNISPKNPLVSCDEITKMDFSPWANCTTSSG